MRWGSWAALAILLVASTTPGSTQGAGASAPPPTTVARPTAVQPVRSPAPAPARTASPATERLALEAWSRPDESQQWARVNALWALPRLGSPHLEPLLAAAERVDQPHLSAFASKFRRGEVTA